MKRRNNSKLDHNNNGDVKAGGDPRKEEEGPIDRFAPTA